MDIMAKKITRYQHTAVRAKGKRFKSVLAAFKELDLPVNRHQKFRQELRKAGKAVFRSDDGRITFQIANDNNDTHAA